MFQAISVGTIGEAIFSILANFKIKKTGVGHCIYPSGNKLIRWREYYDNV